MSVQTGPATAYRHLTREPGTRGGHVIIEGTRIGVHDVICLLQNGETVDSILTGCFPNITRAQVYESLAYYEDHRGEIDVLVGAADGRCDVVRFLLDHDVPDDIVFALPHLVTKWTGCANWFRRRRGTRTCSGSRLTVTVS